jgi:ferritin-like metal-binding protein YciE
MAQSAAAKDSSKTQKTTKGGRTKTVSRAKPAPEQRSKRAQSVASRAKSKASARTSHSTQEKGLADLLEHGLRDMYYAEKKIYRSLPKMIKAADDDQLVECLTAHREETQEQIEILESVFELMGLRASGVKCDAIDGILEEAEGILEDFGGTLAGNAAIIFSARAVEHYEMCRYSAMEGFADALGLDEVQAKFRQILDQENAAEQKLTALAEGTINEAASEYDEDEETTAA